MKAAACGTPSGYKRHRRNGEEACRACLTAQAAYRRNWEQGKHAPPEAVSMAEHPLIKGLLDELPARGETFAPKQLLRWLEAAKVNLDLIYEDADETAVMAALPVPGQQEAS